MRKSRRSVPFIMLGPVDQCVMMIILLPEGRSKRYHHHSCRLDYAFSFPRQKRVSNFPIRAAMKLSAACILCCVPMLRISHKQLAIFRLQARFVRLPFSVSKCTKNESRRPQMDEMHLGLVGIVAYNDVRDDPASKLHTRSDQRRL